MIKKLKQDKKIKVFKDPRKSIMNPNQENINGKIEDFSDYLAEIATKKKPKKKMPKMEKMFYKPKK